ncbi:MAG: 3'(2'),5'-bisphosphate nucleotidase CysQ [Marinobacter sp.]|nr:3'(2'),5'-bisphosphate nucleotidase CysQ [Marinobacter sp.]
MPHQSNLRDILTIADQAGQKVMAVYHSDFKVRTKEDNSPITAADEAAHQIIVDGLRRITPDVPILSEESAAAPWDERCHWYRFWLVDPVDGTREFTQRSGEFTVNIALIIDGEPVMGVVVAPALKEMFWGVVGEGAWKRARNGQERRISVTQPHEELRVVASKNHMTPETEAFIRRLGPHQLVQAGSSLKICMIAEGRADVYPRLGPTSEWDTAAAHAVLTAAGGKITTLKGEPLKYGKENILNPDFIASSKWY